MKALLLACRLLHADPTTIQEYRVSLLDIDSGRTIQVLTTDKRFYETRRGSCVVARPLQDNRVYYGGNC